jgi:hypothetical protein
MPLPLGAVLEDCVGLGAEDLGLEIIVAGRDVVVHEPVVEALQPAIDCVQNPSRLAI